MMRELHPNPFVRVPGGRLRPRADMTAGAARRGTAVDGRGSLESASVSVSTFRSARVRRFAVMFVALVVVIWAVRFIFAPIHRM